MLRDYGFQTDAEVESLKADIARHVRIAAGMATEAETLRANDARYRWLRDEIDYKPAHYDGMNFGRFDLMWRTDERNLDAAIDAARGSP